MGYVQILPGPERRRRWSEGEKRAIVAAAFAPGVVVAEVARRADVCPSQIYRWRQDLYGARGGFAEVVVLSDAAEPPPAPTIAAPAAIEIELENRARLRMSASAPPELAAAVLKALAR